MNVETSVIDVPADRTVDSPDSSIPSWRQKQRQVREEAILDAAREMIAEQGYEAMTMEDLAERVGISKPTLYQHFPSKEALAVRAVVAQIEGTLRLMQSPVQPGSASEQLHYVVRQMIGRRFDCTQLMYGGAKTALAPVVRAHPAYQTARGQMVKALSEIVEAAKAEGTIDFALSTRVLIQMLFSLVRDTEYDELIKNGESREEEVRETLATIYLNGLRGTPPTERAN